MGGVKQGLEEKVRRSRERLDAHTREMVQWHFGPETGCPFWLKYASKLDFDLNLRNPIVCFGCVRSF